MLNRSAGFVLVLSVHVKGATRRPVLGIKKKSPQRVVLLRRERVALPPLSLVTMPYINTADMGS